MDNPAPFLQFILPPLRQGEVYVGGSLPANGGGGMHQIHLDSIEKLTAWLRSESGSGRNSYMALASYTPHQNKKGTGPGRQGEYVQQVQSFWIDIDCSEKKAADGEGYATIFEGAKALKGFREKTELPKPAVVISGGGLHCYWVLTEPIDASTWIATANKLHTLIVAHGLLADHTRTHDVASVLRPVGTLNFKYEPAKMVELKYSADPIDHGALKTTVDSALANCKLDTTATTAPSNDGLWYGTTHDPYPFTEENERAFLSAAQVAYPNPKAYDEWFEFDCECCSLVAAQGWPEKNARNIFDVVSAQALGADKSKNGELWNSTLQDAHDRVKRGKLLRTHRCTFDKALKNGWVNATGNGGQAPS